MLLLVFFIPFALYIHLFSRISSLLSFNEGLYCKWFASKLHSFTHYTLPDMIFLCKRAKIMTPALRQALEVAISKCTSCKTTGRPLNSKKISFDKLLRTFNDHVQVDFLFIRELGKEPILHVRDKATGYSATVILSSRDMNEVATAFVRLWINSHGPPKAASADVEFVTEPFKDMLRNHGILFEERPARRHNKIGIVESGHNGIRLFVQRLLKDAEYNRLNYGLCIPKQEILSKATFLCNALRGNAKLSSFELARGYSPSLAGLPQTQTSKETLAAYYEQQSKRALTRMLRSNAPRVIKADLLPPRTPVYYFVKEAKQGKWKKGFVDEAREHIVIVTTNSHRRGHKLRIAYEDIRLVPSSELLYELEQLELELAKDTPNETDIDPLAMDSSSSSDAPSSEEAEGTPSVEAALWSFHPQSRSCLANESKAPFDWPEFDAGTETPPENQHKDIGEYQSRLPTEIPLHSNLANKKSCNKYAPSSVTRRCPNRSCNSPRHGSSKRPSTGIGELQGFCSNC